MTTTTVHIVPTGDTIQIAPGQTTTDIPRSAVPTYGVACLMRQPDGSYQAVLKTWSRNVKMSLDICKKLGLDISYKTLRRLVEAGFIQGHWISPGNVLIDINSVHAHIEATRDPSFWSEERKRQFWNAV